MCTSTGASSHHIVDAIDCEDDVKDEEQRTGRLFKVCLHHHIGMTGEERKFVFKFLSLTIFNLSLSLLISLPRPPPPPPPPLLLPHLFSLCSLKNDSKSNKDILLMLTCTHLAVVMAIKRLTKDCLKLTKYCKQKYITVTIQLC